MPSVQYHLFKPLMRIARWSQGNFPVQDANAFVRFRQFADRVADVAMRPPRDVKVESDSLGGVIGDWLIPANAPENPVMLFLHGGGIAFGWNNSLRRELAYIARFAGVRAFGVGYHLVPKYHYPVAHDECCAAYRAASQEHRPHNDISYFFNHTTNCPNPSRVTITSNALHSKVNCARTSIAMDARTSPIKASRLMRAR